MSETAHTRRLLGYALNCFPYQTLAELWPFLERDVLQIKARCFPHEPFPIELRVSDPIVRELTADRTAVAKLKTFFTAHDLALVTINAFVLPPFHGQRVKEKVYLPAWHESEERLRFTNASVDLLKALSNERTPPSVSVPFGALKPVTMAAVAPHILRAGEYAATQDCVVALEPEPGLCVETTAEVIEFFRTYVPPNLRRHLAVNFDLSHQLVQFEDLSASIRQLHEAGIRIAKIHVSNAAEMTELRPFYEDSIYLHQTTGADAAGHRRFFALDWPATAPAGLAKFRCHYHLPVYPTDLPSTLTEVEHFLRNLDATPLDHSVPFIIETYTWPQQLRGPARLVENICREIDWVRSNF